MERATPEATSQVQARIEALVSRYELPDHATRSLMALVELVKRDRHSPTAVRDPLAVVDDHLADSLVALELERPRAASTLADLGSGAGFPGLPLAVALPAVAVTLLEGNARKCAFIARAIETCGAGNARVIQARAEAWEEGLGRFDVVTARAVGPLVVVAEYAAPLLRVGGSLIVWRGHRDPDAEMAVVNAAAELGLEACEPLRVHPYRGARQRHLHVMLKATQTPERFPRRPGVALKRPLGGASARPGAGHESSDRRQR